MDAVPQALHVSQPLPLPARGASTRLRVGGGELLLEAVRGGHSLLWSDGRNARRYALGLAARGALALQLRVPRLPVRVVPREVVVVVPGARLCGYVQVPLVPTLVAGGDGTPQVLLELPPSDLVAEWDDDGPWFRVCSPWFVRFPVPGVEPRLVVPLRLHNRGDVVLSPAHLRLELHDDERTPLRGSLVARARRLVGSGDRLVEQRRAAAPQAVRA